MILMKFSGFLTAQLLHNYRITTYHFLYSKIVIIQANFCILRLVAWTEARQDADAAAAEQILRDPNPSIGKTPAIETYPPKKGS